jgi:hypothetical protein
LEDTGNKPSIGPNGFYTLNRTTMQLTLRIPKYVLEQARQDLARPHSFAFERVGFFRCRPTIQPKLVVISGYDAVPDGEYMFDSTAGACIGATAIQSALQRILTHGSGQVHVHWHEHDGPTGPSRTDLRDQPRLVQSFQNVDETLPHGIVILSNTHAWGVLLLPGTKRFQEIKKISVVSGGIEFL